MSTFICLVFLILDSVLDAWIYPQASHNQGALRPSCFFSTGKSGAESSPDAGHALAGSINSPRQGKWWTRASVQPGAEDGAGEGEGHSISPGLPPRVEPWPTCHKMGLRQGWGTGLSQNRVLGLWAGGTVRVPMGWSGPAWAVDVPGTNTFYFWCE